MTKQQEGILELRVGLLLFMLAGLVGAFPHRHALTEIALSQRMALLVVAFIPIAALAIGAVLAASKRSSPTASLDSQRP